MGRMAQYKVQNLCFKYHYFGKKTWELKSIILFFCLFGFPVIDLNIYVQTGF